VSAFDPRYGEPVPLGPQIARVTAPNSGPFTGAGTNTYLLGEERVMIVDPGPADEAHAQALVRALGGRRVTHILLTHTHRDHADGLALLRRRLDAPAVAEGPHRPSRPLRPGETNPFRSAADHEFSPDIALCDGERLGNGDVTVTAVATPGHTANHMAFAVGDALLTGDHVMGWSTTVIAPPDGAMADYMRSLDRLALRDDARYLPAHGDEIAEPRRAVSAMRSHRLMRERAILARLGRGARTVCAIVDELYAGIDERLRTAAGLSVLAHLEKLEAEGRVTREDEAADTAWRPAGA